MSDVVLGRLEPPALTVPARPSGVLKPVHPGPVLLGAALFVAPLFLSQYWIVDVASGLTFAISCLGLQVLTGWGRQISLMQAGVTGAAAYMAINVSQIVHERIGSQYVERRGRNGLVWSEQQPPGPVPLLVGGLAGIAFAAAICFTVGLVSRRVAAGYVLVLTFAAQFAVENSLFTTDNFVRMEASGVPRPEILGVALTHDRRFYWFVVIVTLAVVYALHRLRQSRFGRAVVFAGTQPEAASTAGISPWRYRAYAFLVAGACAGIAGTLQGPLYQQAPGFSSYLAISSLVCVAVVVLAGSTSLLAVVGVALAVHLGPTVLLDWRLNVYLIAGVAMVVGLLLGPRGVSGLVVDLFVRPRRLLSRGLR